MDDPGLEKLVPAKEQSDYIRKELIKVKDYLDGKNVKHNIMYFLKGFRGKLDTTELYRYIPCYYPWLSSMIDLDGNVYLCCRCYIPVGNIQENSFKEIWFGNSYREMRKEAFQINVRQKSVKGCYCNSCSNFIPNIKLYRLLNPLKGRSPGFKLLNENLSEGQEDV
jgi:MoaA/NifB/PqqE/SkfB family radical SAM enzyme